MDALIPIALILLGLGLVVAEVYLVPGLNVVGVLGVLSMAAGVVAAFVVSGVAGGAAALVGAVVAGGALLRWLWTSDAGQRLVLHDRLGPAAGAGADAERTTRAALLGKTGVAISPLRPTGVVEIEGARVEVETEGAFVAAGSRVRVVALDRRRFLVRLDEGGTREEGGEGT